MPLKHLETTRIKLFETLTAIRKFDEVIESYICDTDEDSLKEIEEMKKINAKFQKAMLMLDDALNHKATQDIKGRPRDNTVRPKLRKLSLKRFDGDPKYWMEFWEFLRELLTKMMH